MPTIIDSLVVRLGLDAKDLNNQAPGGVKKLRDIEEQGDRTESSVSSLSKTMGAFLALIGGTVAIKAFATDTVDANAALERLSKNLGLSVSTISSWGNAVETFGGKASSVQGTMEMLSRAQTEFRLTGESSLIPYFSALGVTLTDFTKKGRPADQILLDLSDKLSKLDRPTAFNLGRMIGIDPDTLNLILQGRKAVEGLIAQQKTFNAVSKEQAESAVKLQRGFVGLKQEAAAMGRDLLQQATPGILKVLSVLTELGDWVQRNKEFIRDLATILGGVAAGLAAIAIATSPITLTVAAVVALAAAIALLWQDYQTWKRGGNSLIDWSVWAPPVQKAIALVVALKNAFKGLYDTIRESPTFQKLMKEGKTNYGESDTKKIIDRVFRLNGSGNSQAIQKYFEGKGWTAQQAAGITANVMRESGGNPGAIGDKGAAYGLGQWHPNRQQDFKNFSGKGIQGSSLQDQLAFIQYELTKGKERAAGNALRGATSAADAGSIVSRLYERPGDVAGEAAKRGALAGNIFSGIPGAGAMSPAGASGSQGTTVHSSVKNQIGEIKVYTQATDAKGIASDIGSEMDYLFTSQAQAGLH